jgi:hypothetical protein
MRACSDRQTAGSRYQAYGRVEMPVALTIR